MQPDQGSVTVWIARLKAGERDAVRPLWERYFECLAALARARMAGLRDRSVDEEDVASRAFDSFVRGAGEGRFPALDDREDLRQVLFMLAVQKVVNLRVREGRLKHGGGKIVRASEMAGEQGEADGDSFAEVMSREPSPEDAAIFAEEVLGRLHCLTEEERTVVTLKLEGDTNEEIARKVGKALATVERRLKGIRAKWEETP